MPPEKPKNTKLKVTSAVVVTFAVVMLLIASNVTKAQQAAGSASIVTPMATSSNVSTSATTTAQPSTNTATSTTYKDGTYTATSSYYVPHGSEDIQVSLTLQNGIITDSNVKNSEGNGESAQYQQAFTSSYKSHVTGKSISSLSLSYIAGASDTTQGFDDAVAKIQAEAKA
ncbi:MAG: hypothetical protein JWN12_413 [Candidatus Saccharibacteria bacterium]|nr:hypothetical protein [Candidatus Saccharibacteria bacterium]